MPSRCPIPFVVDLLLDVLVLWQARHRAGPTRVVFDLLLEVLVVVVLGLVHHIVVWVIMCSIFNCIVVVATAGWRLGGMRATAD